jgi:RND family efflux transporter MFP subunit
LTDEKKGYIQLIFVVAFIVASFVISGLLQTNRTPTGKNSASERALFVETREIKPGPYRITFETTGVIEARANVKIVPEVSGRVVSINDQFFEGGVFKAGRTLFQIEPRDLQLEIQRLKAKIAQASTSYSLEKAESAAADEEWKQLNGDMDMPNLVARKPQIAEALANLKAAEAELGKAKLDLRRTRFTLPFNGRVLSANLEKGQFVAAGQSYGEAFDVSALEVNASLEDKQLEWLLSVNNPDVKISATYLGKHKVYKGILKRNPASFDAKTRFATVRFGFGKAITELLPGVFVTLKIQGPELQNIALLPGQCLQKDGFIWTIDADGKLRSMKPDVAYSDGKQIAISNITEAMTVVTSRLSGATEGAAVLSNAKGAVSE